ncbi:tRNA dimethylallyltransferase, mitochondrial [Habropoda laboriosa]|uniref:tRNA dimethylallyltransferase, mitochondrial n=1 Tax=Habropoda laboriosa TaxID=597456 RepID=A0A0L7QUR7_9HYME|nr:tRNA dimethylallyltransferase, mitochondrial [Habropoda laboriosa]
MAKDEQVESREGEDDVEDVSRLKKMKIELDRFSSISNDQLFNELMEVDPEMANKLHPNNRRKIIRSLEVLKQHGVRHSELLKAQRAAGGCGLGGPLRHPNSVLLWLRCDQKVLETRLDSRVDAMVETGLVQELLDFHRRYNEQRIKSNTVHGIELFLSIAEKNSHCVVFFGHFVSRFVTCRIDNVLIMNNVIITDFDETLVFADYTTGIFQSIGFKEFHAYLVLPEEERREKKGEELLEKGIADLKLVTKKYSKKQEQWIMNRIMRRSDRQVPPVYALDCTDVNEWNSCVYEPAVEIIETILRGEKPEQTPLNETVENHKFSDASNEERHYCSVCERVFIGNHQWDIHRAGQKHMKVLKKKRKLEQQQKQKQIEESP